MKAAAPRPIIAISRLQSRDCFGVFRRMAAYHQYGTVSVTVQ